MTLTYQELCAQYQTLPPEHKIHRKEHLISVDKSCLKTATNFSVSNSDNLVPTSQILHPVRSKEATKRKVQ